LSSGRSLRSSPTCGISGSPEALICCMTVASTITSGREHTILTPVRRPEINHQAPSFLSSQRSAPFYHLMASYSETLHDVIKGANNRRMGSDLNDSEFSYILLSHIFISSSHCKAQSTFRHNIMPPGHRYNIRIVVPRFESHVSLH
jgi:hypothetical protein